MVFTICEILGKKFDRDWHEGAQSNSATMWQVVILLLQIQHLTRALRTSNGFSLHLRHKGKELVLSFVWAEDQVAATITKWLGSIWLKEILRKLCMIDIYAPTWGGVLEVLLFPNLIINFYLVLTYASLEEHIWKMVCIWIYY